MVASHRVLEMADERAGGPNLLTHTMVLDERTLDHYHVRYPAIVEESSECDFATTLVAEEVPVDFTLFDDRLVIPRFAPNTSAVSMLFDTDDPDALAWARQFSRRVAKTPDRSRNRTGKPRWTGFPATSETLSSVGSFRVLERR